MSETATEQEPNRIWEVSCHCGFSERFRWEDDASEAFMAHSKNSDQRCGPVNKDAKIAYPKGGFDVDRTLPQNRPNIMTEPEVADD